LHYSPMGPSPHQWTSPIRLCFLLLLFVFVIFHLLISVSAQLHHLYFGRPLSRLPRRFSFTIHSVNMTNPIQPTYSDK
jgi:hypothetical protein